MSRKQSSGIGRGKGRRAAKAKAVAKTPTRERTSEEILQSNIKITERIAAQGLMPEEALNYDGTSEERTKYYEAIDRIYKKLPEGYGYSFREEALPRSAYTQEELRRGYRSGKTVSYIQIELVTKSKELDRESGKMKTKRHKTAIWGQRYSYGHEIREGMGRAPGDGLTTRSAILGMVKAQVYKAAGKVYDPKTKGTSEKYKPLDSYGHLLESSRDT